MAGRGPALNASSTHSAEAERRGLIAAVAAYATWGFLPLYFHALSALGAAELVAHRIIWSFLLLIGVLALRRSLREFWGALVTPRVFLALLASALLILINWLIYIWAVEQKQVIAASLGYFLNPLVNVLLGRMVLGERLGRLQWLAVALAGCGVGVLAIGSIGTLWISLALAISFGLYGLVRKLLAVGPLVGLGIETGLLVPLSVAWLIHSMGQGHMLFGAPGAGMVALVLASGIITTVPLLLFAYAAQRLRLSTLGLLQYLAPTIQFLIGFLIFGEAVTTAHMIAFPTIWAALAIYSWGTMRGVQQARRTA